MELIELSGTNYVVETETHINIYDGKANFKKDEYIIILTKEDFDILAQKLGYVKQ